MSETAHAAGYCLSTKIGSVEKLHCFSLVVVEYHPPVLSGHLLTGMF
jgi:hypothetical protein